MIWTLVIANDNDERFIFNDTKIEHESRRQLSNSPKTHVTIPKRIIRETSITKTFMNHTFNNNDNNPSPTGPTTMKHNSVLHAHAKPNHEPMQKPATRKQPSYPRKAISNESLLPITTSLNPQKYTAVAFNNLHGESSNDPGKLMKNSNTVGIDEDLLLSMEHSNDPLDRRQPDINQHKDDSDDNDYMINSEE